MATVKSYKVRAERFAFGGKTYQKGDTFDAETKSAHVTTALHFKQITEAPEPKAEEPKEPKPDPKKAEEPKDK